jgi:hypothetical protein
VEFVKFEVLTTVTMKIAVFLDEPGLVDICPLSQETVASIFRAENYSSIMKMQATPCCETLLNIILLCLANGGSSFFSNISM